MKRLRMLVPAMAIGSKGVESEPCIGNYPFSVEIR
jgi:hypothetical protein